MQRLRNLLLIATALMPLALASPATVPRVVCLSTRPGAESWR